MKSVKTYTIAALVVTMSIIIIGISGSYAYFVNRVESVNPEAEGVSFSSSGPLSINFATTKTINATAASLVNDSDVLSSQNYTQFSITLPSNSSVASATYNLYLTDILMTSNFKSGYLKWALYKSDNTLVNSGNFASVTLTASGDKYTTANIDLKSSININKGSTDTYKLYMWLSNDTANNQISLLNGTISAKVGFRAVSN